LYNGGITHINKSVSRRGCPKGRIAPYCYLLFKNERMKLPLFPDKKDTSIMHEKGNKFKFIE
jgi:hypothetical protein